MFVPAVCDIYHAYKENRAAVFGEHLSADVVNHPDRAILAYNPVCHPVDGILGTEDLLANLLFHTCDVLRVHHGFEGAAHILIEFHVILASEHMNQCFIRKENLLFSPRFIDQTAYGIPPPLVFFPELVKGLAVTEVCIPMPVNLFVHFLVGKHTTKCILQNFKLTL